MKRLVLSVLLAACCAVASDNAYLCRKDLSGPVDVMFGDAPQYVRGPSGTIYKACWSPVLIPDSETHTNITVQALGEIAPNLPTIGKSVAISGISDQQAFMAAFGLARCDEFGNQITEEP